jgi:hypothetical protein
MLKVLCHEMNIFWRPVKLISLWLKNVIFSMKKRILVSIGSKKNLKPIALTHKVLVWIYWP